MSHDPADKGHPDEVPKGADDVDWNYYYRRRERRSLILGVLVTALVVALAAALLYPQIRERMEDRSPESPESAP